MRSAQPPHLIASGLALALALFVMAITSLGCESNARECSSAADCFSNEICSQGTCRLEESTQDMMAVDQDGNNAAVDMGDPKDMPPEGPIDRGDDRPIGETCEGPDCQDFCGGCPVGVGGASFLCTFDGCNIQQCDPTLEESTDVCMDGLACCLPGVDGDAIALPASPDVIVIATDSDQRPTFAWAKKTELTLRHWTGTKWTEKGLDLPPIPGGAEPTELRELQLVITRDYVAHLLAVTGLSNGEDRILYWRLRGVEVLSADVLGNAEGIPGEIVPGLFLRKLQEDGAETQIVVMAVLGQEGSDELLLVRQLAPETYTKVLRNFPGVGRRLEGFVLEPERRLAHFLLGNTTRGDVRYFLSDNTFPATEASAVRLRAGDGELVVPQPIDAMIPALIPGYNLSVDTLDLAWQLGGYPTAFLLRDSSLYVLDASDPDSPKWTGTIAQREEVVGDQIQGINCGFNSCVAYTLAGSVQVACYNLNEDELTNKHTHPHDARIFSVACDQLAKLHFVSFDRSSNELIYEFAPGF